MQHIDKYVGLCNDLQSVSHQDICILSQFCSLEDFFVNYCGCFIISFKAPEISLNCLVVI